MHALTLLPRLLAATFGAALVMTAWSEFVFFNEGPAETLRAAMAGDGAALGALTELFLLYAIPATLLIGLMGRFGARGSARVLLMGALTGYAIEGAMVPAVYEAVPFSYLWTSVAWHGPVTIGLGLFLLPWLMARGSWPRRALTLAALGAGWGVWTTWAWADPGFAPLPVGAFAGYAATTTCIMGLGYALLAVARWPGPRLPRWASYALMSPSLLLFAVQGLAQPLGALGLFAILGALVLALARLGRAEAAPPAHSPRNWAALPLLPLAALVSYAAVLTTGLPLGAEDLISLSFAVLLGVWVVGVIRGLRR